MSSSYYLLCMSHDPATVIRELSNPSDLPTAEELTQEHPNCDLIISRHSGAPVEFGCPGLGNCPCDGHSGIRWIGIEWLKVLWVAIGARSSDIMDLANQHYELRCWNFERLHRLRRELGD